MKIILRRETQQPNKDCTLGLMFVADLALCTIERPWLPSLISKGGQQGRSCVPVGTYRLVKHDSESHPETFALVNPDLNVVHLPSDSADPNARSAVLIHSANRAYELRGCIAPGTRAGKDAEGYGVFDSRKAMSLLHSRVPWIDGHTIEIS